MKKWIINNGLYIFWLLIGIYALASYLKTPIVFRSTISIVLVLFYGLMSAIMYEFHRQPKRLLLQLAIVAFAIIIKIIDSIIGFNMIVSSLVLISIGLIFIDSLSIDKLLGSKKP